MSRSTESVARSSIITASTEGFPPLMASGVTTGTNTTPTAVIVSGITATRESGTPMLSDSSESSSAPDESGMLATMSRLIQAQTEALVAQTRAAATQHLPPLKPFTGEGIGMDDGNSFEKWIEHFEERAGLVGWNEAQQLHQLKLLLEKTASKVFQMLPVEDKASYSRVKDALKTLFRSVDIEELRGMEFHRLVQTSESVEKLGMEIQQLGHRAFPSVTGNDLDCLLKGRFFQTLLVRWQRKLGTPKVEETFQELF